MDSSKIVRFHVMAEGIDPWELMIGAGSGCEHHFRTVQKNIITTDQS